MQIDGAAPFQTDQFSNQLTKVQPTYCLRVIAESMG